MPDKLNKPTAARQNSSRTDNNGF